MKTPWKTVVYKGDRYKAHTWDQIHERYGDANWKLPMRELTWSIIESGLSSSIYGVTSMHTLLVFQTPTFDFSSSQILRVGQVVKRDEIEFTFQGYRTVCPASEGFKTLVFILSKRLKWISGIATEPNSIST